jgi:hypothetical protein
MVLVGHVLARLTGFGLTLIPISPYTFQRSNYTPGTVNVTRWKGPTAHTATVTGPADAPSINLTGAQTVDEVVDILSGPTEPLWRIETSPYLVEWPEGFTIDSPPANDATSPFYLRGPEDALIYIQGPYPSDRIPPLNDTAAPGQQVTDHQHGPDFEVVELTYQHEGADWHQSHHLVPLNDALAVIVTTQSPATQAPQTRLAAKSMARSVITRPSN